jgi:hypothetical protein
MKNKQINNNAPVQAATKIKCGGLHLSGASNPGTGWHPLIPCNSGWKDFAPYSCSYVQFVSYRLHGRR